MHRSTQGFPHRRQPETPRQTKKINPPNRLGRSRFCIYLRTCRSCPLSPATQLQTALIPAPPLNPVARVWATATAITAPAHGPLDRATTLMRKLPQSTASRPVQAPYEINYSFYRRHTENLLRRYLYASMQIGRAPSLLGDSVGRGYASSRRIRTFEDAVIFVLDIERCLDKLTPLDRQLISRIVLQEYTQTEAASLCGICVRTACTKFPLALDRLTEMLVASEILILPD